MSPLPNPTNQITQPEKIEVKREAERAILKFTEPESKSDFLKIDSPQKIWIWGGILIVLSLALAIWKGDTNLYFLFVFSIVAVFALISQQKNQHLPLEVIFTNLNLWIGNKYFKNDDLAGFWLERDGDEIIVNIELKKPTITPINFLFPGSSIDQARVTLSKVIQEVEPRQKGFADNLNRYIRL